MNTVIDCARALGEAIVASEEFQNMQKAERAATADPALAAATGRYLEIKAELDERIHAPEPDAEAIARCGMEMDELQRQMNAMPAAEAMTEARQRFSQLMTQVNRILESLIAGEPEQGGCTGNCATCGGCK